MKGSKMLAAALAVMSTAALAGCAETLTERNFGDSVRQMIRAQTYDPATLENPPTEAPESSDGQRAGNVLDAYRTGVTKPETASQGVAITVDEAR